MTDAAQPPRWLPKGPVPENDEALTVGFSELIPTPPLGFSIPVQSPPEPAGAAVSDGSTASYYELPEGAQELQDLISFKNMNAQIGEAFRALYRYGESSHSSKLRDAKKALFYLEAEIKRLKTYES